ncbi:MAG TPA: hypothetical protein VFA59_02370 [Vicinamibacterales bacterium]|nr:hypothetical protein [Vicinamibacterales bacterium]
MSTLLRGLRGLRGCFCLSVAATIVWTWPLALGLARDVPADFGDPLLNAWILAWDVTHLGRGLWNANIFYPHPLTLAYSEHLLPQAIAIAPMYALTKNPILCYNLVFLSTFVLAAAGAYLLAREFTGRHPAAMVAGLAFAFAPYRVAALPHVQVLSSAWMPFTLFAFRRYFVTGRTRALVGAGAAWTLQNLSCGYYLLFFSPIVMVYLTWEVLTRRSARQVAAVAVTCAAVVLATTPFVLPYLHLRQLGFGPRPLADIEKFSADVYAYFTADPNVHVWGWLARGFDKPEGALFPGVTVVLLAIVAVARGFQPSVRRSPGMLALRAVLVLSVALLLALLLGWTVRLPLLKITSVSRMLIVVSIVGAAVVATSTEVRSWFASPAAIFSIITLAAIVMSFGPDVHSHGRRIAESAPYAFFYHYVPGFDGLRVPARFGMIATLGLATLAAFGITTARAATVAGVLIVVESLAAPIPVNQNDVAYKQRHLRPLPDRVSPDDFRELYSYIAQLSPSTAIVELPLGEPAFDVRYMFYSTRHWKPLINGYSGGAPDEYGQLDQRLQEALVRPARAWEALRSTGATHVIVHEASYDEDRGPAISNWLRNSGAHEVAAFGRDRVLVLK